ncbi:hypothetical protein [Shewanella algae]|uniref:hypothetical protein n=1 Tax=Shewanella algae TaxID=38313 RepID=UPI00313C56BC
MAQFAQLKARHRLERDGYPQSVSLRIHRSLSWLNNVEQHLEHDKDAAFIFYWIAFNAAYSCDINPEQRPTEQKAFNDFIKALISLDTQSRLESLVWTKFAGPIRIFLDNRYVFQPFWDFQNGKLVEAEWQDKFESALYKAHHALANQQTDTVLGIVLSRLYTLRNQLIHGGATWKSRANRDAIRDATAIMADLVTIIISIMMDNSEHDWGAVMYPVVGS